MHEQEGVCRVAVETKHITKKKHLNVLLQKLHAQRDQDERGVNSPRTFPKSSTR